MPVNKDTPTFGPYTAIRRVGDLYFVSGQIGVNPSTKTAGASIEAQTTQAIGNMLSVLASEGLTLRDVVKTTVFLTDVRNFEAMNNIYVEHFDAPRPARSTIGVKELPRVAGQTKLLVEIEAVAAMPKSTGKKT